MARERYYISTFFWSTATKVLNSLVGFISVPLLISLFGRAEYGVLTLATSCNAYMHLLDFGTNTGAVKFFSQWRAEGNHEMISKVAHTNLTFYTAMAIINAVVMVALALFGEGLFNITHDQFILLRWCLLSIAVLSVFSWGTTTFNQLLVSDMQMAYTMKMQFIQVILKIVLIAVTLLAPLSLPVYFFLLNLLLAALIIPYAWKCRRDGLIDNFRPGFHWKEFRIVLMFSLSLFVWTFFQMTATESRPIVLGIFYPDSADTLTDFKIISVVPGLIITIGAAFSTIFLPGSSELIAKKDQTAIDRFAYKWTRYTTIIANILCMPFILCAGEVLSAYVGAENAHLAVWMIIWCITALIQIHTAPGNSLIVATGRIRPLVTATAIGCVLSIVINILLCRRYGVGSAVIGYLVYALVATIPCYAIYYRKILNLSNLRMFMSFLVPTAVSVLVLIPCMKFLTIGTSAFGTMNERLAYIIICLLKTACWLIPYIILLFAFRIIGMDDLRSIKPNKR